MTMRVGIDLSALGPLPTGVGRYAACLLDALLEHPDIESVSGYAPRSEPLARHAEHDRLRLHPGRDERRLPWMHLTLPQQIRKDPPDIFHFPNYLAPVNFTAPYVVTVHDMTVFDQPGYHPLRRRLAHRLLLHRSLKHAAGIIAVSEDTRRQITKRWPELDRKITVIPEAALAYMVRVTDRDELDEVRLRYELPEQFIISPGGTDPRKNLPSLKAAIRRLRSEGFPHVLAVTGPHQHMPIVEDGVHDLGYVSDYCLRTLYTLAGATVYPSWYEGFGLPPLESFACGTPVIASNAGAIPEVCGGAALLVDPADTEGLTQAIRRVLSDRRLAEDLAAKGTARSTQFSWAKTAALTVEAYRSAIGQ